MATISVVIPTMNTRPDLLREALRSVEAQSRLPNEIIIVNNGREPCLISSEGPSTRVVQIGYRAGAAQARNSGASLCSGDYIAFLDDDDLWAPDYLEQINFLIDQTRPHGIVARLDKLENHEIVPYKNADTLIDLDTIFTRNPGITGSSLVVEKTAFLSNSGFNAKLVTGEDKALVVDMILAGREVVSAPLARAIHRVHSAERLSDSSSMAEGVEQFYRLYRAQMSFRQRCLNLEKVYRYRAACQAWLYPIFFSIKVFNRCILMRFSKV